MCSKKGKRANVAGETLTAGGGGGGQDDVREVIRLRLGRPW